MSIGVENFSLFFCSFLIKKTQTEVWVLVLVKGFEPPTY